MPDTRTDAAVLAALAAGDGRSLDELYDRHAPWLRARLLRRCPDAATVEDALQDTFLVAWRRGDSYGGRGPVAAWLWGIASRRLIDQLRRRPLVGDDVDRLERSASPRLTLSPSAEEQAMAGPASGTVDALLGRLTPRLRAVVQATVLDDLTTEQAAVVLRIPSGTVKTRMMRARHHLREALAEPAA